MTEEADTHVTEPEPTGVYDTAPTIDGMLEVLVRALNDSPGGALGITVSVNGAIISGLAIGRDDWMAKQEAFAEGHPSGPVISELATKFTLQAITAEHPDFDEWFLHLATAKYLGGLGRIPSTGGLLMRVRLSEVDSWSVSYFGDAPDDEPDDEDWESEGPLSRTAAPRADE